MGECIIIMTEEILYMEDDKQLRELGRTFLENEGFDVRTYDSPEEEGIDCYEGESVVVTDYAFEGEITGMDVAEALNGEAEVIIYTGHDQEFVERDAGIELPEGIKFLTKGGEFNELIKKVDQAIED
jgi:DNA-binding NtrC family response regulator